MKEQNVNGLADIGAFRDEITVYIKKIKFKKKLFGGVDEYEVWKKIQKLDEMYCEAMKIQRIQYEALLAERDIRCATIPENEAEGIANGEA